MMSHFCNRYVREFLILASTWFAFGLPSKTGCDTRCCNKYSLYFIYECKLCYCNPSAYSYSDYVCNVCVKRSWAI
jgi:hypothetical protein